jgi:hypothetical protein
MSSVLKFGDGIHKSTRNVERRHADVDVEHNPPEGGASGGIKSLEGKKHGTEAILAILLCGEKVTIFSSLNRRSRCAFLNDEVEGGDERQEIPSPLVQVGIAISVQNRVGMTLKKGRQDRSLVKLFRVQGVRQGDLDFIGFRTIGRCSFVIVVDFQFQGLVQLARRHDTFAFVVSDKTHVGGNLWVLFQKLEDPFLDASSGVGSKLDRVIVDGVLGQADDKKVGSRYAGLAECPPSRTFKTKW